MRIRIAALDQIGPKRIQLLKRYIRKRRQTRIWLGIARQHRNQRAMSRRRRMQRFQRVVEVAGAAQRSYDDQLRMPRRALDIGIDGHRMLEAHQAGDAQRPCASASAMRGGDRCKLRIGGREEQDVAGRLTEIDRLLAVADRSLLG